MLAVSSSLMGSGCDLATNTSYLLSFSSLYGINLHYFRPYVPKNRTRYGGETDTAVCSEKVKCRSPGTNGGSKCWKDTGLIHGLD